MQVPALYIVPATNAVVPCQVRIHSRWEALGGVKGTSFSYAEAEERGTEIIFWRDQIPAPARNAILSVEPGEAYSIDTTKKPDDQTVTAKAVALDPVKALAFPVPDTHGGDFTATLDPALFGRASTATSVQVFEEATVNQDYQVGDFWQIPLSQLANVRDVRPGLFGGHQFFDAQDRFRPYALNDQYFLRFDLDVESPVRDNNVRVKIDIGPQGGPENAILTPAQPIFRETGELVQSVSIFTRVFVGPVFIVNGAAFSLAFAQDTRIVDVGVYVST